MSASDIHGWEEEFKFLDDASFVHLEELQLTAYSDELRDDFLKLISSKFQFLRKLKFTNRFSDDGLYYLEKLKNLDHLVVTESLFDFVVAKNLSRVEVEETYY